MCGSMKKKQGICKRPLSKGPGAGLLLDRLLIPRIEQYGLNNNYSDVDGVIEYLRRTYREYQRRQLGPFRTMVTRAIGTLQRKGGIAKPELQLQTLEAQHLARVARTGVGVANLSSSSGSSLNDGESSGGSTSDDERDGSSSGGGSGDGGGDGTATARSARGAIDSRVETSASTKRKRARCFGSGVGPQFDPVSELCHGSGTSDDDSSSDPDLEPEQAKQIAAAALPAAASHMNNSLLNMYARTATPIGPVHEPGSAAGAGVGIIQRASSPPPFASPEIIAAAAARALAKERAERKESAARIAGRSSGTDLGASGRAAADPDGPSTSGRHAASARATVVHTMEAIAPTADSMRTAAPVMLTATGSQAAVATAAVVVAAASRSQGEGYRTQIMEPLPPTLMALAQPPPQPQPQSQAQPSQVKSAAKRARRLTALGGSGGAGGGLGFGGVGGGGSCSAVTMAKPVSYGDLGGIEEVLSDIRELIEYPLKHPEVYAWLGVEPPRGVLLHGPPGCGKTALANAIANECGVPFLRVSAPEIVSGMSGESEAKLRQLFGEARDLAPCIVFIDEIDAIFPKRETAQREMERRIVAQMLTCMDDLSTAVMAQPSMEAVAAAAPPGAPHSSSGDGNSGAAAGAAPYQTSPPPPHVVVIGATNRPDALDPALRRAGRFDREIALGIPTEAARVKILQVISRRLRLEGNFDFRAVAKRTPGFVGADLAALTKEAAAVAVTRIFAQLAAAEAAAHAAAASAQLLAAEGAIVAGMETGLAPAVAPARLHRLGGGPLGPAELEGLAITMADFEAALPKVQPSVRREGFTTTPDVTWDDVGALAEVREELSFAITEPIRNPECFEALGLPAATGVLLYGPPGCGKTLVAKAVANESGANFISIKGPELLNKYVGESERAVRQLFARARAAHPCVLFFDEMDALAPRRGTDNNQAAERVVNQLLTEMDGVDSRQGIFMVAATNRPDMIDPALLRPGRLDKVLYVPLPPPGDRAAILRALVRRTPLELGVDLDAVAIDARCDGFSGADMAALVREAAVAALKESMAGGPAAPSPRVGIRHFEVALRRVQPSVNRKDRKAYEALRLRLRSTRAHMQPDADSRPVIGTGHCVDGREVGDGGIIPGGSRDDGDALLLEDAAADVVTAAADAGAANHAPAIMGSGVGSSVAVSMDDQDEERNITAVIHATVKTSTSPIGIALWPKPGQNEADGEGEGDVMETT